jgi:hypothetical protein
MGFFSSDRSIEEYAQNIWKLEKIEVPKPTLNKENRIVSTGNLVALEKEKVFEKEKVYDKEKEK